MADSNHENDSANRNQAVLLSLCGLSPAVVSETVWALARETPPTRIDKVVVLTTAQGRAAIERELFDGGAWQRLRSALQADSREMRFGRSGDFLRVIPEDGGCEMTDVATSDDSLAAADFLLESLRQFTENPDTRVVFSIAGGRKTMSALAALCMTLLARPQDRLCHVLVNPPFDTFDLQPKFYFPEAGLEHTYQGSRLPSAMAKIYLHDIPYVRCREVFRREYARLPGNFLDTVRLANRNLSPLSIEIKPHQYQCLVNRERLLLSPAEFTFY